MDLSGGLNTKKDPHALDRNQLAISTNTWLGTGNAVSKRPGNTFKFAATATSAYTGYGISSYFQTYGVQGTQILTQQIDGTIGIDGGFLGTMANNTSASPLQTAQMYDPQTGYNTVFLVDGHTTPQTIQLNGVTVALTPVITSGTNCPYNHTNTSPITPRYVTTAGFYLVYAGEPTEPTGVYISNPYYPQTFNLSSTTTTGILPNPYIPYLVGFNDGVAGGNITGIRGLADGSATGAIMVYKQAAVYRMNQVGFFGEMYWGETLVSSSVGCLAPQSIVAFDTFHCFLGIDGVYQTDGSTVRRISDNVPTFFDSTLSGTQAAILNRATATAVRHGQRYIIFFDDGNGTSTAAGYATLGVVFDFAKLDADGYPAVTTIRGMTPAAMVPLRGPLDDGNFYWIDALTTNVNKFGLGSSDLGNAIQTTFYGKADFMIETFGPESPLCIKDLERVTLLLSSVAEVTSETLIFTCFVATDVLSSATGTVAAAIGPQYASLYGIAPPAGIYGIARYIATGETGYNSLTITPQVFASGRVMQVGFSESSIYPWTILGYIDYVARHRVDK
jgi:hypothetical protein